ncbi:MAG: aldose 1-epimerase family protein [Dehalococcoidia bacterium]|nr:aldose 1-epimerase family protein [Dehalococcoidia bacterium]
MAELFGREWSREDLAAMTGDISQIGGVKLAELTDGPERGVRVADCRTGGGLSFTVLLDRGMDIGAAEYKGVPLAWLSGAGFAHPAHYEPEGVGWLRTFGGGLMTGCGLTQIGAPSEGMEKEPLGLHGRLSVIPARGVIVDSEWEGDEYRWRLQGRMKQYRLFSEHLELRRTISFRLGGRDIRIEDSVTNLGDTPSPFMLLYHVNLGFPLLSPESEMVAAPHTVEPRDDVAAGGLDAWARFQSPAAEFQEQVFLHDLPADHEGMAEAALRNPWLGLSVHVRYRKAELPYLTQWRMMGKGTYVLGLEPGNAFVLGQAAERAAGRLQTIEPGEEKRLLVEIGVREE